jgi:hypothetical protein
MNLGWGLLTPHPAFLDDLPKEQGILTEEEFQAKKKQILDL